jgi:V/A-type H+-transporting ATPase subunit A
LPDGDKLLLLTARMIREDFLQQSAYHEVDTYCAPAKAGLMLKTIMKFHELAQEMLNSGAGIDSIRSSPMVYRISRMKDIPNEAFEQRATELWLEMEKSLVIGKPTA